MRKFLLVLLGFAITLNLFANPVNPEQASKIAKNFYLQVVKNKRLSEVSLSLAFTEKSLNVSIQKGTIGQGTSIFYIYNVNQNDGFVIVAADDYVTPILGYSISGSYSEMNVPPAFRKLLEKYKNEIVDVILNDFQPEQEIQTKWENLENVEPLILDKQINSVNPLLTTTWDQSPYVNDLCPYDVAAGSGNGYHCVSGCPATAMAQILKFWNYPTTGTGFHSYNHSTYGTLSANFASTTYNWSSMPNNVSSANTAVATLMYHCGVAVEMDYGPMESASYVIISSSPTPEQSCEYAFKTYFGYNASTIQGLERSNYSNSSWINLLKNELNNGRPIQYAGFGQGGHTFVCDGYDNNNYFHMNWGWGGNCDGFFSLDALNPGTGGAGSGAGTYNLNQQALIGIQPTSGTGNSIINMYSSITVNPNPIDFAQSFTVNVNVTNAGSSNFSGDFCAALFTSSGDFIDYIEILSASNSPLQPGYHYTGGITFSNSGMLTVPGSYKVGIFYRNTNGNWNLAGNSYYQNPINVTINSPSDYIQLYSSITPLPTTFVQGQPASVNFNLINDNNATYYGTYEAALYDLQGNFVQTIGTYNETDGLPANYLYSYPYITLSTSSITAPPGTYILAIEELENGYSDWYLVGGEYHPNPITINVTAPSLSSDIYEANNTEGAAYNLSISFSGNTATKNTVGSNIHIGSDLDYYKINLPTGYNYTITARVHDSYNSGNGNTYTGDVMFSYKHNSVWSDNFDDVMPSTIYIQNGGTVIFNVTPYFAGETGTYLLALSINRTPTSGIEETDISSTINIYPNPAQNYINVQSTSNTENINSIQIYDNIGKEAIRIDKIQMSCNVYQVPVSELSNGLYFLKISFGNKTETKKFTIHR